MKPMGDVHAATEPFADGALKLETVVASFHCACTSCGCGGEC